MWMNVEWTIFEFDLCFIKIKGMENNDFSNTDFIENANKTVIVIIGQWY